MEDLTSKKHVRAPSRESFARWQNVTITQLGYAINLFLMFATASLGFLLDLIKNEKSSAGWLGKTSFFSAALSLIGSILVGVCCSLNRLRDFRTTMHIAHERQGWTEAGLSEEEVNAVLSPSRKDAKKLGDKTWNLFNWQIRTFVAGILLLVFGFSVLYHAKLF
jgi:hypothetical protein